MNEKFRKLPQVNDIILKFENSFPTLSNSYIKDISTEILEFFREKIKTEQDFDFETEDVYAEIFKKLSTAKNYSLQKTINGTGVILHTNLGRSPLSKPAIENLIKVSEGYSNLEYNLNSGKRGSRYDHIIELLKNLTKAEDALIVNNNAAAVFLIANTFAKDKETLISRGEMVEVGDGFRISSIISNSGTKLIEVGATNRTHLKDYEEKIGENTKLIMKVHTSNYKIVGFHEEVSATELKKLTENSDILVAEDLGSGSLIDLKIGSESERTVQDSINEGIDLVSFSCDKLLGGPQGGIICGRKELISKIKKNQLLRAFRVCKMTLAALEATLFLYLDENKALKEIPTLRMISSDISEISKKAQDLKSLIEKNVKDIEIKIVDSESLIGGGAYPLEKLKSKALEINPKSTANDLESFLRLSENHIITNVYDDKVHIDLRCIDESEYEKIIWELKRYYE